MSRSNKIGAGILLSNAVWNLARYVINWMMLLVVPPFLIHRLSTDTYATWMLLMQIATYYSTVDINMQTAVSRFTARSAAQGDRQDMAVTLSSITLFLVGLACAILVLGLLAAAFLGIVFPAIPDEILPSAQISAVIIVFALAISLPFVTIVGAFLGFQRNRVVTIAIVVSKMASGIAMVLAVKFGGGLISLGLCFAVTSLLAPLVYLRAWWRFDDAVKLSIAHARTVVIKDFASYSGALGFVAISSILMSGLALPILGIYDFQSVPVYSLAMVYGNMLLIPQAAILVVALPMLSGQSVEGSPTAMATLLIRFARFSSISLVLFSVGLLVIEPLFLRLWIGPVLAEKVRLPAILLLLAQFVGLTTHPYRIAVLGVGQVMKTIPAIFIEGLTSIILSLIFVQWWGGTGVALAILLASLLGIVAQSIISMPRTNAIEPRPFAYFGTALGRPLLAVLPAIAATVIFWRYTLLIGAVVGIGTVVLGIALCSIGYMNLTADERRAGYDTALSHARRTWRRTIREGNA